MIHRLAIIFFSKDRAMQLRASIASLQKHAEFYTWADTFVLFKSDKYKHQYADLGSEFKEILFIPEINLVEQIQKILTGYDALMFVVDDTMFYRSFNLPMCVYHLFIRPEVIGFSLRLGRNVNWSHIKNISIKQPMFQKLVNNYHRFRWPGEEVDFGYPLEVSSSIYRTQDISPLLAGVKGDPGDIESRFSSKKHQFTQSKPYLLCFDYSVAFAAPVNIVRNKTFCPAGREYSYPIEKLALLFDAGKHIDISFIPESINGCHQEMEYKFI